MKKIYSLLICLAIVNSFIAKNNPLNTEINSLPNGFIENKGQIHDQDFKPNPQVKYLLNTPGMNIQLKTNSFSYDSYSVEKKRSESNGLNGKLNANTNIYHFHRIDVQFIGANASPEIISEGAFSNISNYYLEGRSKKDLVQVKSFSKVTYKNLYPNIDLEFVVSKENVKYNFILHYGSDINKIKWKYQGSENTDLKNENISIGVEHGSFEETIPESYFLSESNKAKRSNVKINFKKIEENVFGFSSSQELSIHSGEALLIDPTLSLLWATYYGGNFDDCIVGSCVDNLDNTYYSGYTASLNAIATAGSHKPTYGGGPYDGMILKFAPSGNRIWATYFGGTGDDGAQNIVIDKSNNLYVSGFTNSTASISSPGSHQVSYGGGTYDAFLLKLTNSGSLIWSTYYGGNGDDRGFFCQLDTLGNIYLAGPTSSSNSISTTGAHQTSYGGGSYDGFLVKFNPSGVRQWATYYGGSDEDAPQSCAVDFNNNVYITGYTKSTNSISTTSSHQVGYGGMQDVFLAKFNPSGIRQWGTYYGGSKNDLAINITCDSLGSTYITGWTGSVDSISSAGSHQPIYGGCDPITACYGDAFVTKFDSTGVRQWGTYYGGTRDDNGTFLVAKNNAIYLCGVTLSHTQISTSFTYQDSCSNNYVNMMLVKFTQNGTRLWATYLGPSSPFGAWAYSLALDGVGSIYLSGQADLFFPVTAGAHQTTLGGSFDGVIVKFREGAIVTDMNTILLGNNEFHVFPNPSVDILNISGKQNGFENSKIEIINYLGQVVLNLPYENSINISNLSDGFYSLKITTVNKEVYVSKFIKQ